MLLKTLSLVGFKSFADRTRLEFGSGVNVVVGPNGTGKSNLLDAMAWVLGTQAASSLRTHQMSDVIFAGTATRPALGRAEVAITFSNELGLLPLDLAEITISRRLHRDGTSEYQLNGAPCRLLDIQELLSDSGVGRHQHVLVSQGQIGDVLNARPDEHRTIIEEAAGITKHRSRRDRSIRRLEQTGLDVDRLHDILEENRRRLRPLKRQANAAMRYDDVKSQAVALRLWISGESLRDLTFRTGAATEERAKLTTALEQDAAALRQIAADLIGLSAAAGDVGKALEADTAAAARLEATSERIQGAILVAKERRSALESRAFGADARRSDLTAERVSLLEQVEASEIAERESSQQAETRQLSLVHLDDEERALAEQIQLPTEGVVANLRGDLRALETAAQRDEREKDQLVKRRESVATRIEEETAQAAQLIEQIKAADADLGPVADEQRQLHDLAEAAQQRWDEADLARQEAHVTLEKAKSRSEALESALSGLGDPEARSQALRTREVIAPVVAELDPPAAVASAVDAALGAWSEALVTESPGSVAAVAGSLKSSGLGGVTLLALEDESEVEARARDIAAQLGITALVDELGPNADTSLADALLGDVVVVEGWSSGWDVVNRHPELRAVTPEGDLISRLGMRLATPDGAGHAALEAAHVASEAAATAMARAVSSSTTAKRDFDQARHNERDVLEKLEALEAVLAGQTEALGLNERSRAARTEELERLSSRLAAITEAGSIRTERIDQLRLRVAEFEGEEQARQEAWDALNTRRSEVATRRDEERRLAEAAAAALAGAIERRRMLEGRLVAIDRELAELDGAPVSPEAIADLREIEDSGRRSLAAARNQIEVLRARQRELREQAGSAGAELEAVERSRRELETAIARAKERSSELAIELAELRVRHESVVEGLRRDADSTEESALAAPHPDFLADEDPQSTLNTLEAQLRRMGPINPLAAAEYTELAERVESVEAQLEDLESSRAELRKVIKALDDEMAIMFMKAFGEIAAFYQENFALVFPGGRGSLRLIDPDNPLETGVEISAQPAGKKVGRLSLLSGGERSLAALAFLFAVFRSRPSPFYVLDEVEAALDDANLRRFLRLVDTLRESAQLVVITHQQQTMEAADILYGVTMEPGGSSRVLSQRLDRASV
ncbi:MAG: chromosome segregation protein SMC [bacterium]|nr:chromosome segregation protein SMC [bacterium]